MNKSDRTLGQLPDHDRRGAEAYAFMAQFKNDGPGPEILMRARKRDATQVGVLRLLDSIQTIEVIEA